MTDEERHELCDILRNAHPSKSTSREAADEIERLTAALAEASDPLPREHQGVSPLPRCQQEREMIVEGRQELINSLYVASDDRWSDAGRLCKEAAEEIERLAALAQSDAEPVAWRYSSKGGSVWGSVWYYTDESQVARKWCEAEWRVEPLYAAPPRPDASVRLIEAAEAELNEIRDCMLNDRSYYDGLIGFAGDIEAVAATLRARAADRSEK